MTDPLASIPAHMLSVREVADRMHVSRMTVYRLIQDEKLRAYRIGRSLKVDARDVVAFVRDGNTIVWELGAGGAA